MQQQLSHAGVCEGVTLYAWVLLPNHYRLLVATPRGQQRQRLAKQT